MDFSHFSGSAPARPPCPYARLPPRRPSARSVDRPIRLARQPDDQTRALQNAIDACSSAPRRFGFAASTGGNLRLPAGTQLLGVARRHELVLTEGPALLAAKARSRSAPVGTGCSMAASSSARATIRSVLRVALRIVDCEISARWP